MTRESSKPSARGEILRRAAIVASIIGAGLTLFNKWAALAVNRLNRAVSMVIYGQGFAPHP